MSNLSNIEIGALPLKSAVESLARKMHRLLNEKPDEPRRTRWQQLSKVSRERYLYVAKRMIEEGMVSQ